VDAGLETRLCGADIEIRSSEVGQSLAQAIVFYISGHGFGHASRSIEVINAILAQRPETRVGVRTSAPRWLFDLTVKGKVSYSTLECDTGVVQSDALTLDEADSIRRAASFHSDLVTRAASETRSLRELGAGLIVGDIPPLAFAVGASAGIPSIGLGNFTWDWIYADYPRVRLAPSLLPTIRGAYAKASMALRLPMSGGFESFANVRDIPFIARRAHRSREEVCKLLRIPADKPLVLSSFGGFGLSTIDTDVLAKLKKYTVLVTTMTPAARVKKDTPAAERKGSLVTINEEAMYNNIGVRYEDLVGASEVVVTKPGYGIISECIANDSAVLYTPRGHFPEYDVLVDEMPKYVRSALITHEDLVAGKWESALDKLLAQPKIKKKPEINGAEVAADILLKALDKPPKKPRGRPKVKI
jgi:L-arabinokinase